MSGDSTEHFSSSGKVDTLHVHAPAILPGRLVVPVHAAQPLPDSSIKPCTTPCRRLTGRTRSPLPYQAPPMLARLQTQHQPSYGRQPEP